MFLKDLPVQPPSWEYLQRQHCRCKEIWTLKPAMFCVPKESWRMLSLPSQNHKSLDRQEYSVCTVGAYCSFKVWNNYKAYVIVFGPLLQLKLLIKKSSATWAPFGHCLESCVMWSRVSLDNPQDRDVVSVSELEDEFQRNFLLKQEQKSETWCICEYLKGKTQNNLSSSAGKSHGSVWELFLRSSVSHALASILSFWEIALPVLEDLLEVDRTHWCNLWCLW